MKKEKIVKAFVDDIVNNEKEITKNTGFMNASKDKVSSEAYRESIERRSLAVRQLYNTASKVGISTDLIDNEKRDY